MLYFDSFSVHFDSGALQSDRIPVAQRLPIDFGPSKIQVLGPQHPSGVSNGGSGSSIGPTRIERQAEIWRFALRPGGGRHGRRHHRDADAAELRLRGVREASRGTRSSEACL